MKKILIHTIIGISLIITLLMSSIIFLKVKKPTFLENMFPGIAYTLRSRDVIGNFKEYLHKEEERKEVYETYRSDIKSKNAKNYLYTETNLFVNQGVHPDVIKISKDGSETYYMAFTPYPFGRDKYENPHLVISSDGKKFKSPKGIKSPLVSTPENHNEGGHFSDTDMIYDNGKFIMYFVYNKKYVIGDTKFYSIESSDGINWSHPKLVYSTKEGYSPTVVKDNNGYKMWYLEGEGNLVYSYSNNPYSWKSYKKCNIKMGKWIPWHIDIQKTEKGYEGLVCARNPELNTRALFYVISNDGVNFKSSVKPILFPTEDSWDNKEIYRSCFIKENGKYRIWYSARGNYYKWHIGYTEYTYLEIGRIKMQ